MARSTIAAVQRTLEDIWCEVLKLEALPEGADFFQLGGASLEAIVVTAKASRALGVKVPVRLIMSTPALSDYALGVVEIMDATNVAVAESA